MKSARFVFQLVASFLAGGGRKHQPERATPIAKPDHVRIEGMLFEGLPELVKGNLRPDLSRPGNGLILKRVDAKEFVA